MLMRSQSLIIAEVILVATLLFGSLNGAQARTRRNAAASIHRAPASEATVDNSVENLSPAISNEVRRTTNDEAVNQYLATGDADGDLKHYQSLHRHMGVDLGMMVPFGDFQSQFSTSPLIGMHLSWEAIPPVNFLVSFLRSSSGQKDLSSLGKLSVTSINVGAVAVFPIDRVQPFVKLEGSFLFNDVNFNDGRTITSGNDIILTSVGLNLGFGLDFVVGREVSLGLDLTYHYAIPKRLNLSNGSTFDLGSNFATVGLRVNF